jgi:hypothetical protein
MGLDFELTKSRDGGSGFTLLIAVPSGDCAKFAAKDTKRELLVYMPTVKQPVAQTPTLTRTLRCVWRRDSGLPFPARYTKSA